MGRVGAIPAGSVSPAIEKALPVNVDALITSGALPDEVSMTYFVVGVLIGTVPKFTLDGLTVTSATDAFAEAGIAIEQISKISGRQSAWRDLPRAEGNALSAKEGKGKQERRELNIDSTSGAPSHKTTVRARKTFCGYAVTADA
jgi:hypothetical protein